jgi:hypothetical protein
MDLAAFTRSLAAAAPPPGLAAPLQALWWAAAGGGWDAAHGLVQDEADRDSAPEPGSGAVGE